MSKIKIGTCIKGEEVLQRLPQVIEEGYETVELYFNESTGDVDLPELAAQMKDIIGDSGVEVSSIGLYCNPLQYESARKNLEYCIDNAGAFGATVVGTFAGALEGKVLYESLPVFKEVFGELTKRAESNNIKIGIENAHMYGHWYNTKCNIGYCPKAWELMFNEVNSDYLGLEWEPSHQIEQLIDPLGQLKQWIDKVVHIHGKDAHIDYDSVRKYGIWFGAEYCVHRFPGLGDTNWKSIFKALKDGGYNGDIAIEGYHDPVYNGDREYEGQKNALEYLKTCRSTLVK